MGFLHPSFLWALLFLALPIIVHLFNLRKYKKEYFSNISLLKTILSETQKTSKIKKRLLLASRLLAMFFLILSFVQPIFNSKHASGINGQPIVSIYIDNSFSMESSSGQLRALDVAKQKAREIMRETEQQGLYQILTNDFAGNQLQLLTYPEAIEVIKSIEISSNRRLANDIWDKQIKTTNANNSRRKFFYWVSDFQKNQFSKINQITNYPLTCIPIEHNNKLNIYIDTAYILSSALKLNQDAKVIFRVRKSKDDKVEKSLITLTINDVVKNRRELNWGNKDSITDTMMVKLVSKDWQFLRLDVSNPSITFDNEYYFTLYVSPKPFISLIGTNTDQKYIVNALKADENFDVHTFNNFELGNDEVKGSNLIIINQLQSTEFSKKIPEWLKANKHVAIFLPEVIQTESYSNYMNDLGLQAISEKVSQKTRLNQFNLLDPTLQNIFTQIDKLNDLPSFSAYYQLNGYSQRAKEVLISFDNGNPFLIKYSRLGEGNVYLFTANISASKSDFVFSSLFAPLLYKIASVSGGTQMNSYLIGSEKNIVIPIREESNEKVYKIKGGNISIIPPQKKVGNFLSCQIHESILESGFYGIENSKGEKIYNIALNHRRAESDMEFMSAEDIKTALSYTNLEIDRGNSSYLSKINAFAGLNLWKVWVVLALTFLLIEMGIVLFWDKILESFKT